jgi:hypothetical protein
MYKGEPMKIKESTKLMITIIAAGLLVLFLVVSVATVIYKKVNEPIVMVNIGMYKDSKVIPTSFNEDIKTQIVTSKGVYIYHGTKSFEYGKEVIVREDRLSR